MWEVFGVKKRESYGWFENRPAPAPLVPYRSKEGRPVNDAGEKPGKKRGDPHDPPVGDRGGWRGD